MSSESWTLQQLVAQAALLLSTQSVGQPSGRVRDVPDTRTIRYYTTLGILDRPDHFQGRTAYYSHKHLLQLMAIKRLQAQGMSLSDIQQRMLGIAPDELVELAGTDGCLNDLGANPSAPRKSAFWKQPPPRPSPSQPLAQAPHTLEGLRLHPSILLLLENPERPLSPDDVQAIAAAAEPLIKLLHARRLVHVHSTNDDRGDPNAKFR